MSCAFQTPAARARQGSSLPASENLHISGNVSVGTEVIDQKANRREVARTARPRDSGRLPASGRAERAPPYGSPEGASYIKPRRTTGVFA